MLLQEAGGGFAGASASPPHAFRKSLLLFVLVGIAVARFHAGRTVEVGLRHLGVT